MEDIHDLVTGYRCRGYRASTRTVYHDIAGVDFADVGDDGSSFLISECEVSQRTRSEDSDSHPGRGGQ